ncbi:glycosyltransferase family 4 protein [Paenibacillus sp. LHD-117]|uniref:glycosyltransferase family 4 protein n=1 Tax=Paenibacillus sp. LHD-117 TaxID=3071412 RepID=UPI0027E1546A|nr:glycosyltransferase family 4 protein [Paenibacillus sp. LHD-117]MDQ6421278.1 glycosyltransferase family 4 protein [Paenibacillus sp. LHD-117]
MDRLSRQEIIKNYVSIKPFENPQQNDDTIREKVLLSPHGIGISTLAHALRSRGVHATSCSFYKDVYSYLSDVCLNLDQNPMDLRVKIRDAFFEEALETYDIFHFRFGLTFFDPDKSDLKIYSSKGKKVVAHLTGVEARLPSVARSFNNRYIQEGAWGWTEERIREHLNVLSAYIDHAIICDHELMPHVQPYFKKVHIVPYAINANPFTPKYPSPDIEPIVVHAPSNREVKGTEFILKAVERLQKEGHKFQFRLVEKIPREQAKQIYQKAAIVIDQLSIGTYANLSMEAMALGKPVICYIRDDLRSTFPPGLPIVSATPDTIYEVLKDLLNRPEDWPKLGLAGRSYVEQTHNYDKVAQKLIDVYNQL